MSVAAIRAAALATSDPAAARRAASSILREGRFHPPSIPRPLHGLLHAIGTGLGDLGDDIGTVVHDAGRVVPGGPTAVWVLLGLLVVASVTGLVRRRLRHRVTVDRAVKIGGDPRRAERPEELERDAETAERDGRFGDAVRLRFRAGLVRLAERNAILVPRFTPNAAVARIVNSPEFDGLALRFDEIAYGAAPATADDAREARERWSAVLGARRGG